MLLRTDDDVHSFVRTRVRTHTLARVKWREEELNYEY